MTPPPPPLTPAPKPKPEPRADDTMRRLQIGISGVLAVLLLVGLAGLIGGHGRDEAQDGAKTDNSVTMPGEEEKSSGSEPLAELGVQPAAAPGPAEKKMEETVMPPRVTVPDLEPDPELERARKTRQ